MKPPLDELRTQWVGKFVQISNKFAGESQSGYGKVVDIVESGRKLARLGYPYIVKLEHGSEVLWNADTKMRET